MNQTLQRKKSFEANDVIHDQFVILGKLDNKEHSSKIFKGTHPYPQSQPF